MKEAKQIKTISLPVEITLCKEDDLARLESEVSSSGKSKFHEKRLKMQKEGIASYLVAWSDGKPVGHLLVKWNGLERDLPEDLRHIPELNSFVVAEGSRRKGVGTELIRQAEFLARQKGVTKLGLLVEPENIEAKSLYEKLGYEDSGRGTYTDSGEMIDDAGNKYIDSVDCLAMVKDLRQAT